MGDTSSFPFTRGALFNGNIAPNKRSLEGICRSNLSESHHAQRFSILIQLRTCWSPQFCPHLEREHAGGPGSQLILKWYPPQQHGQGCGDARSWYGEAPLNELAYGGSKSEGAEDKV